MSKHPFVFVSRQKLSLLLHQIKPDQGKWRLITTKITTLSAVVVRLHWDDAPLQAEETRKPVFMGHSFASRILQVPGAVGSHDWAPPALRHPPNKWRWPPLASLGSQVALKAAPTNGPLEARASLTDRLSPRDGQGAVLLEDSRPERSGVHCRAGGWRTRSTCVRCVTWQWRLLRHVAQDLAGPRLFLRQPLLQSYNYLAVRQFRRKR